MKQYKLFPKFEPVNVPDLIFGRADINLSNLKPLKRIELEFLCRILGITFCGTKKKMTVRILDRWNLRQTLSEYDSSHEEAKLLANFYRRVELYDMCRRAKIWKSGSKIALAVSLLSWRNLCRHKGQKFFNEMKKQLKEINDEKAQKLQQLKKAPQEKEG